MMLFSSKYQRHQEKLIKMLPNCFPLLCQSFGHIYFVCFKTSFVLLFLTTEVRTMKGGEAEAVPAAPGRRCPWSRTGEP